LFIIGDVFTNKNTKTKKSNKSTVMRVLVLIMAIVMICSFFAGILIYFLN